MFQSRFKTLVFLLLGSVAAADDSDEQYYELVDENVVQECEPIGQITRCSPLFGCEVDQYAPYKKQCEFDDGFRKIMRFIEAHKDAYPNEDISELQMTMFEMSIAIDDYDRLVQSFLASEKVYDSYYRDYLELQAGKPNLIERISEETGVENDIISTLQIIEQYFKTLPDTKRREIQLVLKARGLYQSDIDGIWGRGTRIAFAVYLAPLMQASSADNLEDLISELKRGFVIENLWARENYEEELRHIWSTESKARISSEIRPNRIPSTTLPTTTNDSLSEPFVKNMLINGEMQTCIKVGNSWNCD
jgi:hypothetical protein